MIRRKGLAAGGGLSAPLILSSGERDETSWSSRRRRRGRAPRVAARRPRAATSDLLPRMRMPSCAYRRLDLDRRTEAGMPAISERAPRRTSRSATRPPWSRPRRRGAIHATAFRQVAHGARASADASIVCVAPNACATASRSPPGRARRSGCTGQLGGLDAVEADASRSDQARLSPALTCAALTTAAVARDHAAGQQARAVERQLARDRHDLGAVDEHLLGEAAVRRPCDHGAARCSQRTARSSRKIVSHRVGWPRRQVWQAPHERTERDHDVIAGSQAVGLAVHRLHDAGRLRP